jgi:N-hydroxyarylamine O-acetyltransferase
MSDDFHLDAYFNRIGYGGPARPDLETLSAICARHVASIPFEGLDPLMGRPVPLDLASLQAKLVKSRRGGYCFEQNTIFNAALRAIGFRTTGLGARVTMMSEPGAPLGPRGHMVLRVDLPDGPYIADVGFGAALQDAPLRLAPDVEQLTPFATYRLAEEDGLYSLNVRTHDVWRRGFVFTLEPQLAADYEVANWFFATNPRVPFTRMIVMQILKGDARVSLVNTALSERKQDGRLIERTIASAAELGEVLNKVFDIEPPAPVEQIFAKIAPAAG